MDWGKLFSADNLNDLGIPIGIGIVVAVTMFFLRRFLYRYIKKLTQKTKTQFDDIMVQETSIPSMLWCFWLGIWVGFTVYAAPESWSEITNKVIPVLFIALAIYTAITIFMAIFKWYKTEVCGHTSSSLDDIIMNVLIFGTPILGGGLGIILILNMLGYKSVRVNTWMGSHGPKLAIMTVVITTVLLFTVLLVPKMIDRAVRNAKAEQNEEELKKRSDTLVEVIVTTVEIFLIFMFLMMALSEIGINITAVLAGASVVGVAVGFGAQSLVKDVISGLFIIMENQYRKGDVVKIAGETGVVEEINLRRTILRDVDGTYHVVPNGEIRVSSNLTKLLSRVNLNVSVAYDTNLDKAIAVINQVGKEMAEDPIWSKFIISPPKALRVDKLGDSGIEIRVMGETRPSRQWEVSGEFRLRVKKAFDKENIEIPFPHTKVIFGNLPPDFNKFNEPRN
jgi:moderate conductance mechanosensitive channel